MRFRLLATIGIVLGLMLVASVVLAGYPDQEVGRGNTTTWVMNVHETLEANVVASYVDRAGYEASNTTQTISPTGNASFPALDSGVRAGWLGSTVIHSLRPLASVAQIAWEDVPQGDGWTGAAYTEIGEGATQIFFPATSKTAYHRSITSIQCLDSEDCPIYMTYRDREGNIVTGSPFVDTVEARSQETYDLWDSSVNPNIPDDVSMPPAWHGGLQVTSTQHVAGVSVKHWRPGYAAAHNSLARSTDTEIYFPSVNRRNWNNWKGASDWSGLTVQNVSYFAITVRVNFYDRDGNLKLSFTDEVPANSPHAYNTRYGGSVDPSTFDDLGNRFLGSTIVTSTHPILGACTLVRYANDGLAGAYDGVASGSSKLLFPVAYRALEGTTWRKYSGVVVLNMDPQHEITVYAQWHQPDGTLKVEFSDTIPANSSYGYNTRYGGSAFEILGDDWAGTVIVTTTSPAGIAGAVTSHIGGSGQMYLTMYDAVVVE